jgi:hypothetical protein
MVGFVLVQPGLVVYNNLIPTSGGHTDWFSGLFS